MLIFSVELFPNYAHRLPLPRKVGVMTPQLLWEHRPCGLGYRTLTHRDAGGFIKGRAGAPCAWTPEPGWYLSRQKPWGGGEVRQVVSPTFPFPLSLPSPFPFPLSFQTNQWEGRSDPVRGEVPRLPPYKYHPSGINSLHLRVRLNLMIGLQLSRHS